MMAIQCVKYTDAMAMFSRDLLVTRVEMDIAAWAKFNRFGARAVDCGLDHLQMRPVIAGPRWIPKP